MNNDHNNKAIRIGQLLLKEQEKENQVLAERGILINYVKPITYDDKKTGRRVRAWALGSKLHHTRAEHETFDDFIINYLQVHVLGQEWWREQEQAAQKLFSFYLF